MHAEFTIRLNVAVIPMGVCTVSLLLFRTNLPCRPGEGDSGIQPHRVTWKDLQYNLIQC